MQNASVDNMVIYNLKLNHRTCSHDQDSGAFRAYASTITKSFAEDPMVAEIRSDVDADCSHRSTKLYSCKVETTGCPIHFISTCKYIGNQTLMRGKQWEITAFMFFLDHELIFCNYWRKS